MIPVALGGLSAVKIGKAIWVAKVGESIGDLSVVLSRNLREWLFQWYIERLNVRSQSLWIDELIEVAEFARDSHSKRIIRMLLNEAREHFKFRGCRYFFTQGFDLLTIFGVRGEAISWCLGIERWSF